MDAGKKYSAITLLCLMLSACQSSYTEDSERHSASAWFNIGQQDALHGYFIRDNDVLAEWYGITEQDPDRNAYIHGYVAGQNILCRSEEMRQWGLEGKRFPESCSARENSTRLYQDWQRATERWHKN